MLGATYTTVHNLDVDTATTAGTYQGNNWINVPSGLNASACTLYVFVAYQDGILLHQKFIDNNGMIASRTRFNNNWSTWARGDSFGCSTPADLASLLGVTGIANKVMYYFSSEAGFTTNISCNQYSNGMAILVLFSRNNSAGDATTSAIYMLRCGHSGNHLTTVEIAKSGEMPYPTFSVDSNGFITVDIYGCYMFIMNK